MSNVFAIIRIRGSMETQRTVEKALVQLHLTRKNHCVFITNTPSHKGILQKGKDFLTWGEVSAPVVLQLLQKRGRVAGDRPVSDEYVEKNSPFKTLNELADALAQGTATMKTVKGLRPMLRLSPPLKGFKASVKRPYPKGVLGYRGADIEKLLARMM
ncbi:50S ribosomal protein L30 [Candidatus Micrarchaeota archaeon]|nr:50S ribosomal protein L30 [Candidatus Micrarchaeota archaeon]